MKLTENQVKEIVSGYVGSSVTEDGYLRFCRFTENQVQNLSAPGRAAAGASKKGHAVWSAGMKMSVNGDISRFSFDFKIVSRGISWTDICNLFDVYINGVYYDCGSSNLGNGSEGHYEILTDHAKNITVYFPTHAAMAVRNVEIDGDYTPRVYRKKLLAYGDSITHGMAETQPSFCYLNRFARICDFELLSQAVSGDKFCDLPVEPLSYRPDVILVAFGTNDWRCGRPVYEDAKKFYETLNRVFPEAKKLTITPIPRLAMDLRRFDESRKTSNGVTLPEVRKMIRKAAEENGVAVCDGTKLVPASERYYHDGLHPNPFGHYEYALNLTEWYKACFWE